MNQTNQLIYVLLDDTNDIFYCGRTKDLNRRYEEHIAEALNGGKSAKCFHIRMLLDKKRSIRIKRVDDATPDDSAQREAWWINELGWSGYFLKNGNGGSQGNDINEAQLRDDIQVHRKQSKKPKKAVPKTTRRSPEQEAAFDAECKRLSDLFDRDRPAFNREYAAHLELQKEQDKATRQFLQRHSVS